MMPWGWFIGPDTGGGESIVKRMGRRMTRHRALAVRGLLVAAGFLLCAASPPGEPEYWVEKLDGRPFSVGSARGVTVAVALMAGDVIDVEVIVFNDTDRNVKIVAAKIRPESVRREDGKLRRRTLHRAGYSGASRIALAPVSYTERVVTGMADGRQQGFVQPLDRKDTYTTTTPMGQSDPGKGTTPTKEGVTGQAARGDRKLTVMTPSSPIIPPLLVKPGTFGRSFISFGPAEADWYDVHVTVAGRRFRFKYDSGRPVKQGDDRDGRPQDP